MCPSSRVFLQRGFPRFTVELHLLYPFDLSELHPDDDQQTDENNPEDHQVFKEYPARQAGKLLL